MRKHRLLVVLALALLALYATADLLRPVRVWAQQLVNVTGMGEVQLTPTANTLLGRIYALEATQGTMVTRLESVLSGIESLVAGVNISGLNGSAPLPEFTNEILQNAAVADGNGTAIAINGYGTLMITANCATCSGGTRINFELSEDGTNFTNVNGERLGSSDIATSTTVAGVSQWRFTVAGGQSFRARISSYGAGTVTVTARAVFAATPNRSMVPVAGSAGGATPAYLISQASTNETVLHSGPTTLYRMTAINTTNALQYLRLYNSVTHACTSQTDLVGYYPVPHNANAGAGFVFDVPVGDAFSVGLSVCITSASGTTDATATTAGAVILNYSYKQ